MNRTTEPFSPKVFARWRASQTARLEKGLEKSLAKLRPGQPPEVAGLIEAMGYSLLGGGKRVRPLLALAAAEAVGGRAADGLPAALAVEMVHVYSLIHDDLPAMDDDDMRRGRPACHKVYGEGPAILAGDALLTLAFETILNGPGPELRARAALKLSASAGALGMVGGQAMDLAYETRGLAAGKKKITGPMVRDMEIRKTGQLMSAALCCGGILGGGRTADLKALERLGLDLGLAFQIKDDLLDLHGDAARLGKAVGGDAARGKSTFPQVMGEKKAEAAFAELSAATLKLAARFGARGRNLAGIIDSLIGRDY